MWTGTIHRAYGFFGIIETTLGVAGWQNDAQGWFGWAKMSPEWAGVLVGVGGAMILTWLAWEITTFRKRNAKETAEQPRSWSSLSVGGDYVGRDKITNFSRPNTSDNLYYVDDHARTVWFGTDLGDMKVDFHTPDLAIEDICKWLSETGLQRKISPEQVKRTLYRLNHQENIAVTDDGDNG